VFAASADGSLARAGRINESEGNADVIVLLPMTYFVQEMVVRLEIATGQGPRRGDLPTFWQLVGTLFPV
jgi:hypothetical protein